MRLETHQRTRLCPESSQESPNSAPSDQRLDAQGCRVSEACEDTRDGPRIGSGGMRGLTRFPRHRHQPAALGHPGSAWRFVRGTD